MYYVICVQMVDTWYTDIYVVYKYKIIFNIIIQQ